jgi:hypothetical protein
MDESCIASESRIPLISELWEQLGNCHDLQFLWPCCIVSDNKVEAAACVIANQSVTIFTSSVSPLYTFELLSSDSKGSARLSGIVSQQTLEHVELEYKRSRVTLAFPTAEISKQFIKIISEFRPSRPRLMSSDTIQYRDELDATDNDVLHVAQSKQFVHNAGAAWLECAKHCDIANPTALTTVVVSISCQRHDNMHDVFVLTNCAIFIVKKRDFGIIRKTIPIHALQGVSCSMKESGKCSVLLQPNFIVAKSLKSDILLTVDESGQEVLVAALTRQFETITTERLHVTSSEDVYWEKRGFVESQLIRVVNTFRQAGSGSDKRTPSREASIRSLGWLVQERPEKLVELLCEQSMLDPSGDIESRRFLARSVMQAARQFNRLEKVVETSVRWEIRRALRLLATGNSSLPGFLRSGSFACVIIAELVGSSGDQCLRVLLSQVFEDFCSDDSQVKFNESDLSRWTTRLVTSVLRGSETIASLVSKEIQIVLSALAQASNALAPLHVGQLVADYVFAHFLVPSFKRPHKHGIVSAAPTQIQLENISVVSDIIGWLANGSFEQENSSASLFHQPEDALSTLRISKSVKSLGFQFHELMVEFSQNLVERCKKFLSNADTEAHGSKGNMTLARRVSEVPLKRHNEKLLEAIHKEMECSTGAILAVCCSTADELCGCACEDKSNEKGNLMISNVGVADRSTEIRRLEESNALYVTTNRKLQSTVDDLQRMCTSVLNEVAHLQKLLQMRDNEILQLRNLLQPHGSAARNLPSIPAQEKAMSRGVFGCPLDGFALDLYSPVDGK